MEKRIIKFRAWERYDEDSAKEVDKDGEMHYADAWSDEDFTPMQFTGLLDKNGKEIFEGDILREFNNCPGVDEYSYYEVCFGVMNDNRYGWFLKGYSSANSVDVFRKLEIIGNIYENKDLLK